MTLEGLQRDEAAKCYGITARSRALSMRSTARSSISRRASLRRSAVSRSDRASVGGVAPQKYSCAWRTAAILDSSTIRPAQPSVILAVAPGWTPDFSRSGYQGPARAIDFAFVAGSGFARCSHFPGC
jgi:hypothetical protein